MKQWLLLALVCPFLMAGCSEKPSGENSEQATSTSVDFSLKSPPNLKSQKRTLLINKGVSSNQNSDASAFSNESYPLVEYAEGTSSSQDVLYRGNVEFTDGVAATEAIVSLFTVNESASEQETPYAQVRVNSEGKFRLGIAEGQDYRVAVTSSLATTETEYLHKNESYPISNALGFKKQIDSKFTLKRISNQTINITDTNGTPVTHASVFTLFDSSVISAENTTSGSYRIPICENEPPPIVIRAGGYEPRFLSPSSHHGQSTNSVVLSAGGGTVSGQVIDLDHKPLTSGVVVSMNLKLTDEENQFSNIFEKAFEAITKDKGRYRLDGVPTGRKLMPNISQSSPISSPFTNSCYTENSFSLTQYEHREHNITGFSGLTVTGTVYDKETGVLLPNIRVVSTLTGKEESVTDAEGRYSFHTRSDLTLIIEDENYTLPDSEVRVRFSVPCFDAPTAIQRDLEVVRKVEVSGTVLTPEGLPVPKADVTFIKGVDRISVTTDAHGNYALSVHPTSNIELLARAEGFAETASGTIRIGVDNVSGADITLKHGLIISGIVTDTIGNPIPNAKFAVAGKTYSKVILTETNGTFQLPNVNEGDMMAVTAPGFDTQMIEPLFPRLADGETSGGVSIKLSRIGTIQGRFVSADGSPLNLTGRKVQIVDGFYNSYQAFIDSNNSFVIDGISEDTTHTLLFADSQNEQQYQVNSSSDNIITYYRENNTVNLEDAEELEKTENSEAPFETISVDVLVLCNNDHKPITNAKLEVSPQSTSMTITHAAGSGLFSLRNVAKNCRIRASAEGYCADQIALKDSESSEVQKLTVKLVPVSSLSGRLVDAENGIPVRNALVSIYSEDINLIGGQSPDLYTLTDSDGKFLFGSVKQKKFILSIEPQDNYGSFYTSVNLGTNGVTDMEDIRLEKSGHFKGKVMITENFPAKRAEVILKRIDGLGKNYESKFKTDDYGHFSFDNLLPGEYLVKAEAAGKRMFAVVTIESGNTIEIDLEVDSD